VRAIVIEQPNDVALRDVETPSPGPGEVRIRSARAGVCRTDLDILAGTLDARWVTFPVIPGHEWSGVVDSVGERVADLEPGQRVVCEGNIPCLTCRRCRAGDTHLCETYDAVGFTRGGGYGEYVVVPARVVHRIPDHVSFDAAVLVEPAAVVLKALERARLEPGETVGVIGIGALGAIAIRLARLHSPAAVIAYGVREEELALARTLGADAVVNVAHGDPEADLGAHDVVVETAGAASATELATRLAREGGRVVLLGIAGHGHELTLPADRLALRDLSVFGSVGYTTAAWARTVALVSQGLVDLEPIVTHRFPLERFADAFALMDDRRGVVAKIVLEHAA
jgi:2-desacetyl-2-hydroxyethyl bacteriochlorophyllide A dehydrogenase